MKGVGSIPLLVVFLAAAVVSARPFADPKAVDLTADKLVRTDHMVSGSGNARAKIGDLIIQAEQGSWNSAANLLEMRGHVHIEFPERSDHMVFRYGTGNIVTDRTVIFHADRLIIANESLEAWGNLLIRPIDPEEYFPQQVRGEHMLMNLKTGDATVSGNIRTVNTENLSTPPGQPQRNLPPRIFPPEIIK